MLILLKANVEQWLERLEISEYTPLFHQQGYKTEEDIENLKDLKDEDLKAIGISKRGKLRISNLSCTYMQSKYQV